VHCVYMVSSVQCVHCVYMVSSVQCVHCVYNVGRSWGVQLLRWVTSLKCCCIYCTTMTSPQNS